MILATKLSTSFLPLPPLHIYYVIKRNKGEKQTNKQTKIADTRYDPDEQLWKISLLLLMRIKLISKLNLKSVKILITLLYNIGYIPEVSFKLESRYCTKKTDRKTNKQAK